MSKKIYILTSSRADYGIYLPLLKELKEDDQFELRIVAFGTHVLEKYGYTLNQIQSDGFDVYKTIECPFDNDTEFGVSEAMSKIGLKFSEFWSNEKKEIDLVICLGDRFEMFSAVSAASPFNLRIAHLHGGETTLGAIDNAFRHSISMFSSVHFCATESFKNRLIDLLDDDSNIYNVGALSLDNLSSLPLLSKNEFKSKFGLEIKENTVVVTFHPETVSPEENNRHVEVLKEYFQQSDNHFIVTMPNADTNNMVVREMFLNLQEQFPMKVNCVESLGTLGYFSLLKHSRFVFGNSSSGIIEAASFNKFVINLGDRQKGRLSGKNVLHTPISLDSIQKTEKFILSQAEKEFNNPYFSGGSAKNIMAVLKRIM